jgi:hypothetical protein
MMWRDFKLPPEASVPTRSKASWQYFQRYNKQQNVFLANDALCFFLIFHFRQSSVLLIQLMQGSHRPVVQMAHGLASFSAYCDPALTEFDFETEADPSFDDKLFEKELEVMRKTCEIDLPPNIPLNRVERKKAVVLSCTSGGSLSTL